ncbi:DMT family transporter [Mesorhizobium sp. RCC_202]|uniref:DMT family transporter n=1 Tax=Mesorhizobium sp. RCC_202 TaxID=3239222 RepID=UPI003524BC86
MLLPEALAVTAACCSALSSMFLSELKGRVPLLQLARWQMLATFVMTGSVSLVIGGWHTIGPREFWLLAGSSFAGISIASTAYFATIYSVGPRITALLFSLTSPFALALGYLVLGETINHWQALGVLLVLCGIVLAIGMPRRFLKGGDKAPPMPAVTPGTVPISTAPAPPLTGRLWPGILLGVITAIGQAIGTLLARPAMAAGVEPFTAMALRSGLAVILFMALATTPFGRGKREAVQFGTVGLAVLSAFVGTSLGMSCLMAALRTGNVGIISTLSSVTPIIILPLVWLRSGQRPTTAAWAGALLAIVGTALISVR